MDGGSGWPCATSVIRTSKSPIGGPVKDGSSAVPRLSPDETTP